MAQVTRINQGTRIDEVMASSLTVFSTFVRCLPQPNGQQSLTLPAIRAKLARFPDAIAGLPETRFARCKPGLAWVLLAALPVLLLWTFALAFRPESGLIVVAASPAQGDAALYRSVASRMSHSEGYYDAVVKEHRLRGYPLQPFLTVRLPTLAVLQARIGRSAAAGLLAVLTLIAGVLLSRRFAADPATRSIMALLAILACLGLVQGLLPACSVWHEAWAAVFIALSFALRSSDRWVASVVLGVVAVSFRELALPYLAGMAFMAVIERRFAETAAWLAGTAAFALMLGLHAQMLSSLVLASDDASPGWLALKGWPFILSMLGNCSILAALPIPLVSIAAVLAIVGWLAWPGAVGARGALLMIGYTCAFLVVGRTENVYWGLLWAPLLPPGLAFAPGAIRDLLCAAKLIEARPARTAVA